MKARITTQGFAEYLDALAKAGRDIDGITDDALASGGEVLLEGMQRRAPVLKIPDPRFRAGDLRDALRCTEPQKDGNYHYVEIGLLKGTERRIIIYGVVQEFGSSSVSPQPYFRPTLDEDMTKARNAMRVVFKKIGVS